MIEEKNIPNNFYKPPKIKINVLGTSSGIPTEDRNV